MFNKAEAFSKSIGIWSIVLIIIVIAVHFIGLSSGSLDAAPTFQPVGGTPKAIVANSEDKSVYIVDATTDTAQGPYLQPLGIGTALLDVVVTPDGRTAIVSNFDGNTVYFVNLTAHPPVLLDSVNAGIYAEDIALSPDGAWALFTDGSGGTEDRVVLIDVANRERVQTLTGVSARAVAVAPDGETVLVVDTERERLHLIHLNAEDGRLDYRAEYRRTGNRPINVTVSPDGRTALVANFWDDTVTVLRIDGPGDVVRIGEVGDLPGAQQSIAFSPDGTKAYVVSVEPDQDQLSVLYVNGPGDVADSGIRIELPTRLDSGFYGVDTIAVSPDGTKAYVGNAGSLGHPVRVVAVVDLDSHEVTAEIDMGYYPVGIAFFTQPEPTPTPTDTAIATDTPTRVPTRTPTPTRTVTVTPTSSPTPTSTPSRSSIEYLPLTMKNYQGLMPSPTPTQTPTQTPVPLCNGGYEAGRFEPCWDHGGELAQRMVEELYNGEPAFAGRYSALLGQPELGSGAGGDIPAGSAWIQQRIYVSDTPDPHLTFQYRVISYDASLGSEDQLWDTLDVTVDDELVFRDDEGETRPHDRPHERHDTGWQPGEVDLSRWQGQEVVLRFAVWNREYDGNGMDYFNTWAYLDEVRLEP